MPPLYFMQWCVMFLTPLAGNFLILIQILSSWQNPSPSRSQSLTVTSQQPWTRGSVITLKPPALRDMPIARWLLRQSLCLLCISCRMPWWLRVRLHPGHLWFFLWSLWALASRIGLTDAVRKRLISRRHGKYCLCFHQLMGANAFNWKCSTVFSQLY